MKTTKKLFALVMAVVMIMALSVTAFAAEVKGTAGSGSITIENAAKGENYAIYKLFGATVNADGTSIAYTGTIPGSLSAYFEKDSAGNIFAVENVQVSDRDTALKAWAEGETATASIEGDGSAVVFSGLAYGYYVVTTTQGVAITVDSTNPNVTIYDKNTTTPTLDAVTGGKGVDDDKVYIGQTVTYTIKFTTKTYDGAGKKAVKVASYTIQDSLPEFLSNVTVTSITINGVAVTTQQFDSKGTITIDWVDANGISLYDNDAEVELTYTAKVNSNAQIAGNGNTNTATITWTDVESNPGTVGQDTATIYTYAAAIQKVSNTGVKLANAEFEVPYILEETTETNAEGDVIYTVSDKTESGVSTVVTGTSGVVIIKGVDEEPFEVTETKAPEGYNLLTAPVELTGSQTEATATAETTNTLADGETVVTYENASINTSVTVIENNTGTRLPSTGGIGTTIFYVIGSVLVLGAGVLLVTKKRMTDR